MHLTHQTIKKVAQNNTPDDLSGVDLSLFLPNYPSLRGGEEIFKIGWANAKRYIDDEVEDFVKGLHLIELKYREESKNDFGFGSPSPSHKVITALEQSGHTEQAKQLSEWIAVNGGNYYISSKDHE